MVWRTPRDLEEIGGAAHFHGLAQVGHAALHHRGGIVVALDQRRLLGLDVSDCKWCWLGET
jgi:hypothetical protein